MDAERWTQIRIECEGVKFFLLFIHSLGKKRVPRNMAAHGVAQVPASPVGLAKGEELQEYEKILRISDEIFSGTHPKLKVPQQFVRKSASRNLPNAPNTQARVAKASGSGGSLMEMPSQTTPSAPIPTSSQATAAVNGLADAAATVPASKNRTVPKPTSEIDPIFLTKSDDLVRAELQLQRQRVEKILRDQLEHKRQEARQKAAVQDAKPDFDVSSVLNQALELVKPASVNDISTKNGPSDSFDENSFYSSRAPDSPPNGDQQRSSPAPPFQSGDLATEAPVENYSDELQRLEALSRAGLDQEMKDTYPVADQHVPYRQRQAHDAPVDLTANRYHHNFQQEVDVLDEPDYSPPEPGVPPMDRADGREYQPELLNETRRPAESHPSHYYRRSVSPRGDVRIVRNHITSPAAPQPSRVSPLTMAKVPSVPQVRSRYGTERVHSGQDLERGSPDAPAAQRPLPRKRRRLQEDKGRARQVPYNRKPGAADPSEPFIKEEPVSPPPFADASPPALQGRPSQPVYIDIASPRYTPIMERREPPLREPVYESDPYHEVPSRAASRLSARRTARDDQDLRRVASLQNARQPEFAREYVEQPSPRAMRAPSYAVMERPPQDRAAARYYEEPIPSYPRRYVPVDDSPTSSRYREAYYEEEPPPTRMMAPPPRRIVVDEHGNQYYEAPAPAVQFVSPGSRIARGEVYDDGAPVRHASMRATSVFEDPYGGRRYVQEMPPPPSTYRRATDYAQSAVAPPPPPPSERRAYATPVGDREPFPRSSSVQVSEYPRRAAYMEDPVMPRERVMRMPSVRPAPTRYEEPPQEVVSRVGSVRPGGRDMSVYMDEDPQRPRPEYIERPMYVSTRAPPPMREEAYYEGEPERVMMDGSRNVVQRAPPRY